MNGVSRRRGAEVFYKQVTLHRNARRGNRLHRGCTCGYKYRQIEKREPIRKKGASKRSIYLRFLRNCAGLTKDPVNYPKNDPLFDWRRKRDGEREKERESCSRPFKLFGQFSTVTNGGENRKENTKRTLYKPGSRRAHVVSRRL